MTQKVKFKKKLSKKSKKTATTKKLKLLKIKKEDDVKNLFHYEEFNDNQTNIKLYKCKLCNFNTDKMKNIRRHVANIHGGNKCYRCEDCDHIAQSRKLLTAHYRTEHPRRFKCDDCPLSFNMK